MACASFSTKERKQGVVHQVKSLWVDIDCGAQKAETGKGYATQDEGNAALQAFCTAAALPAPTVVNSGRGLHAYWMFTEAVSYADWLPMATKLKAACKVYKLLADPVVTADGARILRVPDTLNFKNPEFPLPVVVLHEAELVEVGALASAFAGLDLPVSKTPSKAVGLSLPKALTAGRELDDTTKALFSNNISRFSTIARKSLKGTGCAQIAHIILNQDTVEEPLWRAGLSVAWACVDKDTAIHKMSDRHPQYYRAGTVDKASMTQGPYRCDSFEAINPDACAGCPHKIASPIALGKEVAALEPEECDVSAEAEYEEYEEEGEVVSTRADATISRHAVDYTPPFPYFRGKNGGVYRKAQSEDEQDKLIYDYDLHITRTIEDPLDGICAEVNMHTPVFGHRKFIIPCSVISSPDKFRDAMSRNGIVADVKEMGALMRYNIDFVKELQRRGQKPEKARTQFGWHDSDTKFVIGAREVSAKGITQCPGSSVTANILPYFEQKGSLSEWKRAFNLMVGDEYSAQGFAIMSTFGSPLLKYTGVKGAMISLVNNKSGTGKTTILHLINSVWGHPDDIMLQKEDTYMSKHNRFGLLQSICTTIDEITNMPAADLSDLVYSCTLGRGRNRMEASANKERLNLTRWALTAVATGNSFIADKLATLKATPDGELMRLIEIELDMALNENADELIRLLGENYGWAGDVYMEHVLKDKAVVIDLVNRMKARIVKDVGASKKERFWVGVVASNIVGGIIAFNLGLHSYNMKAIYRWAIGFFGEMRESAANHIVDNDHILGEFLNENLNAYLIVNAVKLNPLTGSHVVRTVFNKVLARLEEDTNTMYVSKKDFKAYCVDRQVSVENAIKLCNADFVYKGSAKKRMASGTGVSSPPVDTYCFHARGLVQEKE